MYEQNGAEKDLEEMLERLRINREIIAKSPTSEYASPSNRGYMSMAKLSSNSMYGEGQSLLAGYNSKAILGNYGKSLFGDMYSKGLGKGNYSKSYTGIQSLGGLYSAGKSNGGYASGRGSSATSYAGSSASSGSSGSSGGK